MAYRFHVSRHYRDAADDVRKNELQRLKKGLPVTDYKKFSGFVEGFNNKVKALKRRAYGLYNLKHLFQKIYLDLQGYRLFALPAAPIYG